MFSDAGKPSAATTAAASCSASAAPRAWTRRRRRAAARSLGSSRLQRLCAHLGDGQRDDRRAVPEPQRPSRLSSRRTVTALAPGRGLGGLVDSSSIAGGFRAARTEPSSACPETFRGPHHRATSRLPQLIPSSTRSARRRGRSSSGGSSVRRALKFSGAIRASRASRLSTVAGSSRRATARSIIALASS